eukprot:5488886-Prymnesium_polylepis.1
MQDARVHAAPSEPLTGHIAPLPGNGTGQGWSRFPSLCAARRWAKLSARNGTRACRQRRSPLSPDVSWQCGALGCGSLAEAGPFSYLGLPEPPPPVHPAGVLMMSFVQPLAPLHNAFMAYAGTSRFKASSYP